jgi:hypothetical protein
MRFIPALAASLFGLSGAACGGGDLSLPEEQFPTSITALAGTGQSGLPGSELPDPLVVRVEDSEGLPVPGVRVAFELADRADGGRTTPDTALTDSDGEASSRWILGDREGRQTVEAEVVGEGLDVVSFTATATADGPEPGPEPSAERSTIAASPAGIEVGVGESIITVIVRDEDGSTLAGAVVALSATGDGNVLVQPSGPTGANGVAKGSLRSDVPGTKVVAAVVNGSVALVEAAEVTVTVPQTLPARLVFRVQPSDTEEDEPSSPAVEVTVVDADGNAMPVAGIEIQMALIDEHGHDHGDLGGTTLVATGENGIAVFPDLEADRERKEYRLRASVPALPEVEPILSETFDVED